MISIPEGVKVIEFPTSRIWREKSGLVCAISKKNNNPTIEESKASLELFRKAFGNEKVCMLLDITDSSESTREMRSYAAEELPRIVKALALLSNSPLGKMVGNMFLTLWPQPYPVKMFTDEGEARKWLEQYL